MPRLTEPADLAARVAAAPVARLATLRPDGTPRLVPITFVVVDGLVCSAVDAVKPKRSPRLARLADIVRDPRVGLLVDEYDADWSRLWWVRVDGRAEVTAPESRPGAVNALRAKYPMYQDAPFLAPMIVVTPRRWTGWSAR